VTIRRARGSSLKRVTDNASGGERPPEPLLGEQVEITAEQMQQLEQIAGRPLTQLLDQLKHELHIVRREMADMKGHVAEMRADVDDVTTDVTDVKTHVAGISTQVTDVTAQVADVKRPTLWKRVTAAATIYKVVGAAFAIGLVIAQAAGCNVIPVESLESAIVYVFTPKDKDAIETPAVETKPADTVPTEASGLKSKDKNTPVRSTAASGH
jgi:hypothetical protein